MEVVADTLAAGVPEVVLAAYQRLQVDAVKPAAGVVLVQLLYMEEEAVALDET